MNPSSSISRRTQVLVTAICLLAAAYAQAKNRPPAASEQQLFIGEGIAEADTEYGPVRGFLLRNIYSFRGIPYGDDTGGKNRFMPPQPPHAWQEIRPAVAFGASSPQPFYDRRPESYSMFVDHWNYDLMGEDCLRLNIWTPGLADGKRRPVLVWLHGGGFTQGNGIEQDSYDGENIARYGDIVFCSVNHRLGALGFSDLAGAGGEKYRHSGNAGMLDIVAALKWIQANIANFGGDPSNVTVMGQSGGGSKVCLLCAMPAAKGLFHKAVALSGNTVKANNADYAERLGNAILHEAGLDTSQVDSLQSVPWEQYLELANRARQRMAAEDPGSRSGFAPVADGIDIPKGIFFEGENRTTGSDVPLLLCSTFRMEPRPGQPGTGKHLFRRGHRAAHAPIRSAYRQNRPCICRSLPGLPSHRNLGDDCLEPAGNNTDGQRQMQSAVAGLHGVVRLGIAAFQRTPPGFPLHRHRVLAAQHRPHGHTYGRRQRPPQALPQNGRRPAAIHAHG